MTSNNDKRIIELALAVKNGYSVGLRNDIPCINLTFNSFIFIIADGTMTRDLVLEVPEAIKMNSTNISREYIEPRSCLRTRW